MSTVIVALIVAFGTTVGPLFLAHLTGRQRLKEKHEDWRRQDQVAARLLAANAKTDDKLDEIHVLVNSNLTAAMQSELNALRTQLVLVGKLVALTGEAADYPTTECIETRINELAAQLTDRYNAQASLESNK